MIHVSVFACCAALELSGPNSRPDPAPSVPVRDIRRYDERQSQHCLVSILPRQDRANHEQEEWGTVKNRKQAKARIEVTGSAAFDTVLAEEERKLKEEEDKKEQDKFSEGLGRLCCPGQPACCLQQLRDPRNVLRKSRRSSAAKRRGTDN